MRKTLCILSALATTVAFADTADQVITFGNGVVGANVWDVTIPADTSQTPAAKNNFTNGTVDLALQASAGKFYATQTVSFDKVSEAAQNEWSQFTGLQTSQITSGANPGAGSSSINLLSISDSSSFSSGKQFTMYLTVGTQVSGNVSLGSLTGLTGVTVSLAGTADSQTAWVDVTASSGGSYALGNMTVENNKYDATIVKVTGELTGDTVSMSIGGGSKSMVSSVAYSVTPEPTTATLSLLALAGLCARRRRK
ncbi:MAG TPA: hypothetical protein H9976_03465 [Candidatus Akkermansia intestinavium]|nr:hypothetical protein [Candidatus Akkermansia intestinavium]